MESGIPQPCKRKNSGSSTRRSLQDFSKSGGTGREQTSTVVASDNDTDERKVIVGVRVRPLNSREVDQGNKSCWKCIDGNKLQEVLPSGEAGKDLYFDYVFDETFKTQVVYDKMGYSILDGVLHGYNGYYLNISIKHNCFLGLYSLMDKLLAVNITFCNKNLKFLGKTHTLMGNDEEPGLIVLAVQDIFETIKEMESHDFLIRVSYVEIYNEEIKDLLVKREDQEKITIIEDKLKGPHLKGVKEEVVINTDQVLQLLAQGETNRHFGCTNMNARSSRSHTLFKMTFESREAINTNTTVEGNSHIVQEWENVVPVKTKQGSTCVVN